MKFILRRQYKFFLHERHVMCHQSVKHHLANTCNRMWRYRFPCRGCTVVYIRSSNGHPMHRRHIYRQNQGYQPSTESLMTLRVWLSWRTNIAICHRSVNWPKRLQGWSGETHAFLETYPLGRPTWSTCCTTVLSSSHVVPRSIMSFPSVMQRNCALTSTLACLTSTVLCLMSSRKWTWTNFEHWTVPVSWRRYMSGSESWVVGLERVVMKTLQNEVMLAMARPSCQSKLRLTFDWHWHGQLTVS